jgi:hypothetical protein
MTVSMSRPYIKDSRDSDLAGLESAMYGAYVRREEFHRVYMVPWWSQIQFKSLSSNSTYRFWGYVICGDNHPRNLRAKIYSYDGYGMSQDWVTDDTVEHMLVLPITEMPRYVVREDLDPLVKGVAIARLEGKMDAIPHRQDLVDSYIKLSRRSGRLCLVHHTLRDLLLSRIQSVAYKSGGNHFDGPRYYSLNLNGRKYLYIHAHDNKLICPWDIKELEI